MTPAASSAVLVDRFVDYKLASFYSGVGGQTLGFLRGSARVGRLVGRFRSILAIDNDARACQAFGALTGARATCLDLFSAEQYTGFHGRPPPDGWHEVTPDDLRGAAGGEFPDVLSITAPCKGFSGLNAHRAKNIRYVMLNRLTVRSFDLALRAWGDRPPRLILLENVPGIATRGRPLLDAIESLLRHHGYVVTGYTHDCGELGGLAQHRDRYLLVARHRASVPPFLYEPDRRSVRAVGEVLGDMPLPEAPGSGALHRVPRLEWKTWLRLALIEAGKDWKSLAGLPVEDGIVAGLGLVPAPRDFGGGPLGVCPWDSPAGTIAGESRPTNGLYSVADPRPARELGSYEPYGVVGWDEVGRTVTGEAAPGAGPYSVADPRFGAGLGEHAKMRVEDWDQPAHTVTGSDRVGSGALSIADPRLGEGRFNNVFRLVRWDEASPAVTGGGTPSAGGLSVADPRPPANWKGKGKYRVTALDEAAGAVIAESHSGNGAYAVADPRVDLTSSTGFRRGYYGVLPWARPAGCVTGSACHDNGAWSVADPRVSPFAPTDKPDPYPLIVSLDGTWHRPFTTLELAALQGFLDVVPMESFTTALAEACKGKADSTFRLWIGNALPPTSSAACASTMLHTLLLADAGQTFALSSAPIWVDRHLAVALAVDVPLVAP